MSQSTSLPTTLEAMAIVLPVVTTFFLIFSLLEDSAYRLELSLSLDRLFKTIGLSGRAVIPIVLGVGCGTMTTLVTCTLETKREGVIATLLLALSMPCSAQLGVTLGLLSQRPTALLIWGSFMGIIFLAIGCLSSQILPGEFSSFYKKYGIKTAIAIPALVFMFAFPISYLMNQVLTHLEVRF